LASLAEALAKAGRSAAPREHDVARLEIPMDDPLPMRLVQRVGDLDGDPERIVQA